MTTAQVVETSVTVTNSSFQNYTQPDDHTRQTTDTPGFKPFTKLIIWYSLHTPSPRPLPLLLLTGKGTLEPGVQQVQVT